jgi:uncharacterized protein DUF5615
VKVLVDMNLSPLWVEQLSRAGFEAVHWSNVGDPRAPDRTLMLVDDGLDAQHRALLVVHLDPVALHAVLEAPTGQAPRELEKSSSSVTRSPWKFPLSLRPRNVITSRASK